MSDNPRGTPEQIKKMDGARDYWKNLNREAKNKPPAGERKSVNVSEYDEVNLELALAAIATCPSWVDASWLLKAKHGVICTPHKLRVLADHHRDRLEDLRTRVAPKVEQAAANDMMSTAWQATQVEHLAVEQTMEMLQAGEIRDPARAGRDIADIKAKNIDKSLSLQGRPEKIVAHHTPEEIVAKLQQKGVLKVADVEATAIEEGASDGA